MPGAPQARHPHPQEFDPEAFYAALDSHRDGQEMNWKQVSAETGVHASTFTRMAQGKSPDAKGLAALLAWSGLDPADFMRGRSVGRSREPNTLAKITAVLRADSTLKKESAAAIEQILKAAYHRFKE
jgi:hypothetical protein